MPVVYAAAACSGPVSRMLSLLPGLLLVGAMTRRGLGTSRSSTFSPYCCGHASAAMHGHTLPRQHQRPDFALLTILLMSWRFRSRSASWECWLKSDADAVWSRELATAARCEALCPQRLSAALSRLLRTLPT